MTFGDGPHTPTVVPVPNRLTVAGDGLKISPSTRLCTSLAGAAHLPGGYVGDVQVPILSCD